MERDLNKIVGHKEKYETKYINLIKIKSEIKELNKKLEKKISEIKQEEKKNG